MEESKLCGLANLGNLCYQNACIQALYHTPQLTMISKVHAKEKGGAGAKDILCCWASLIASMSDKRRGVVNPALFVQRVRLEAARRRSKEFIGSGQADIDEFLIFLLTAIHDTRARKVDMAIKGVPQTDTDRLAQQCYGMLKREHEGQYSEVLSTFQGIQVARVMQISNGQVLSNHPESFIGLPLPIVGTHERDIMSCIADFCSDATLSGDNAYETEAGQKVEARRGIRFWSLPNVLVIHLKRCVAVGHKSRALVRCPLEPIDFSPYVIGYNPSQYRYCLYAVCQHHGGAQGGHYTCTVNPRGSSFWYHMNDTSATRAHPSQIVTHNSSTFFLRKIK